MNTKILFRAVESDILTSATTAILKFTHVNTITQAIRVSALLIHLLMNFNEPHKAG